MGQFALGVANDFALMGDIGVSDAESHEEAIELRLRKWVRAVVFDGILRRDYHKGARQGVGMAVDGDLRLIHGFEQGGLGLGGGAVDLVGQQEIGEDGAGFEFEGAGVDVIDGDAEHVAGEHVAGELEAVESAVDGAGEHLREGGLADAGDIFDEQVTAGQEADEGKPDDVGLATDRQPKGGLHLGQPGDLRRVSSRRGDY